MNMAVTVQYISVQVLPTNINCILQNTDSRSDEWINNVTFLWAIIFTLTVI